MNKADQKLENIRLIERELHGVAAMLNHRCFNDDPGYYTTQASWEKANALDLIEQYKPTKKALAASITAIVGTDAWNALPDKRQQ